MAIFMGSLVHSTGEPQKGWQWRRVFKTVMRFSKFPCPGFTAVPAIGRVTDCHTSALGNTSVSMKRMFAAISTVRKNSAMAMLRDAKIDLQREPDEPTDIGKEKKSVGSSGSR